MNPNRRIDGKNNILQIMLSRPTVGRIRIGTESSTMILKYSWFLQIADLRCGYHLWPVLVSLVPAASRVAVWGWRAGGLEDSIRNKCGNTKCK